MKIIVAFILASLAGPLFADPPSSRNPSAAARYYFNECGGTSTRDEVSGGAGPGLSANAVWVTTPKGCGVNLGATNGTNVRFAINEISSFTSRTPAFTFTARLKFKTLTEGCILYANHSSGSASGFDIAFFQAAADDVIFRFGGIFPSNPNSVQTQVGTKGGVMTPYVGKDLVVVVVYKSTNGVQVTTDSVRIYLNGDRHNNYFHSTNLVAAFEAGQQMPTIGALGNGTSAGNKCNADIDEVRLDFGDLTGGSDNGAKAYYQSFIGRKSSTFGP